MAAGLDAGSFGQPQGQNLWCGMRVREKPSCVCDGDKSHVFVTFLYILILEGLFFSTQHGLGKCEIISSCWSEMARANFPKGV